MGGGRELDAEVGEDHRAFLTLGCRRPALDQARGAPGRACPDGRPSSTSLPPSSGSCCRHRLRQARCRRSSPSEDLEQRLRERAGAAPDIEKATTVREIHQANEKGRKTPVPAPDPRPKCLGIGEFRHGCLPGAEPGSLWLRHAIKMTTQMCSLELSIQPTQSTGLPVSASACRSPTCFSASAGFVAPLHSCTSSTHNLGGARHILQADPFQRPVDLLHAGEQVRRRHAELGQARAVGAAADRASRRARRRSAGRPRAPARPGACRSPASSACCGTAA